MSAETFWAARRRRAETLRERYPFAAQVLVAKSPCGFRAAYQERARRILVMRSLGCAPSNFWHYEYRNIPRPLWPWDEIETWQPAPCIFQPSAGA